MTQNINIYGIFMFKKKKDKNPKEYHLSPRICIQAHY